VTVLADRSAEPFVIEQLPAQPVLPASIWHRMIDGAGPLRRYLRVPSHAWATYCSLKKYLRNREDFDVIFVPTVLVHHLLGWTWLIKWALKHKPCRVLLFFPNTPVQMDLKTGNPSWESSPTAKLFCRLIGSLAEEVKQGRVVLGVETHPMRDALTQLSGVPFTYFPHPVKPLPGGPAAALDFGPAARGQPSSEVIIMASYGGARHEKGTDILVAAVEEYCQRQPDTRVRCVLQSVEGDQKLWGRLNGNPRVRVIPNYFGDGDYARHLRATNVLLLPYRRSSYALRVSRVVIEAMVQGIPVVTTRGTTLEDQAKDFGAAFYGNDEEVESFVSAIQAMEQEFRGLKQQAERQKPFACEHFSVGEFRAILMKKSGLS
jgi:glycosyltransferase involved in cell wall biosynthesis